MVSLQSLKLNCMLVFGNVLCVEIRGDSAKISAKKELQRLFSTNAFVPNIVSYQQTSETFECDFTAYIRYSRRWCRCSCQPLTLPVFCSCKLHSRPEALAANALSCYDHYHIQWAECPNSREYQQNNKEITTSVTFYFLNQNTNYVLILHKSSVKSALKRIRSCLVASSTISVSIRHVDSIIFRCNTLCTFNSGRLKP